MLCGYQGNEDAPFSFVFPTFELGSYLREVSFIWAHFPWKGNPLRAVFNRKCLSFIYVKSKRNAAMLVRVVTPQNGIKPILAKAHRTQFVVDVSVLFFETSKLIGLADDQALEFKWIVHFAEPGNLEPAKYDVAYGVIQIGIASW